VLIRIIPSDDPAVRDAVIRATNQQTPVGHASLLATDPLHRDIEKYFKSHGWFYERRKSFYKNQGQPAKRTVGINELGQTMMAIGYGRPHVSRSKPSALLKSDNEANLVFGAKFDLDWFMKAAQTQKAIDALLPQYTAPAERGELRWYVSATVVARQLKRWPRQPKDLHRVAPERVTAKVVERAVTDVRNSLSTYTQASNSTAATASKREGFTNALKGDLGF
jgi:hypothetical protein